MGTSTGLLTAFDYALERSESDSAERSAANKAKSDNEYISASNALAEEETLARANLFSIQKENLLREKLASTKARMAASGIAGTSASAAAFEKSIVKKTEGEILSNDYFADLDLKKLALSGDYKQASNLLSASNSGKGNSEITLAKKLISAR